VGYAQQAKEQEIIEQPIGAKDFAYAVTLLSDKESTTLSLGEEEYNSCFVYDPLYCIVLYCIVLCCIVLLVCRRVHHTRADTS
jgi:hypothetical protein